MTSRMLWKCQSYIRCAEEGRVREDFLRCVRSNANGTATFFINGVSYDDSWYLETRWKLLDLLLKMLARISQPHCYSADEENVIETRFTPS
jgi:hypothetical protein